MATTRLMTVEDLERLPDDGSRYDLIRGELIRMALAGFQHGRIAVRIGRWLDAFVSEHQVGAVCGAETGFVLSRNPDVVLAPDAAFVRADRLPSEEQQRGFLPLAPDLAVEIVSPHDRASEVSEKVLEYLDAGVRLVWLIEPRRRTVTAYVPGGDARVLRERDSLDGGAVLPGFRLDVAELFR